MSSHALYLVFYVESSSSCDITSYGLFADVAKTKKITLLSLCDFT